MKCRNDENQAYIEAGFTTLCKSCCKKIFKEQNPTIKAIKRVFSDPRYDGLDTKFLPEDPKKSPLPPLTSFERQEREYERLELQHHDRISERIKGWSDPNEA